MSSAFTWILSVIILLFSVVTYCHYIEFFSCCWRQFLLNHLPPGSHAKYMKTWWSSMCLVFDISSTLLFRNKPISCGKWTHRIYQGLAWNYDVKFFQNVHLVYLLNVYSNHFGIGFLIDISLLMTFLWPLDTSIRNEGWVLQNTL